MAVLFGGVKMKKYLLPLLLMLWVILTAVPTQAGSTPEYWPTKDWLLSTPEKQGMKSEELATYFSTWSQRQFHLDSLVVIRNGYLVAEAYAPLSAPETPHNVYSVTKSVTGALIGILLRDGLLKSLDTPVLSLFPKRTVKNIDARKQAMTVRDLLRMAGGLESNEMEAAQLGVPDTSEVMEQSKDWVQFALDLPMAYEPGSTWYYSNVSAHLLSGIITELTGKSASDYAAEKLFRPLGITNFRWNNSPTGVSFGASELYLCPRDMAKIGYLYLNGGLWDGQQIIPKDYVTTAVSNQMKTPWDDTTYGYLWWRIESINLSFALGYGGQYIMLLPNSNMIVVATGGMTEDLRTMLNGFPMFFATAGLSVSDKPLPENTAGTNQLKNTIDMIHEPATIAAQPLPTLASEISAKPYFLFKPNLFFSSSFVKRFLAANNLTDAMKVQTLTMTFDKNDEAKLDLGFVDGGTWSLPVGLDDKFRISEGRLGTVGVKGEWFSDDLFRLSIKLGGTAIEYRLDLNFIPGALNITSFEYTSGGSTAILGIAMG